MLKAAEVIVSCNDTVKENNGWAEFAICELIKLDTARLGVGFPNKKLLHAKYIEAKSSLGQAE